MTKSNKQSDALEGCLYPRSSQVPDGPNGKQHAETGADYDNRALGYSNFAKRSQQVRNTGYDR
ncbi:MAG: hypothetical protein HY010_23465 [Acidobacteria bacterium]|nr:hypothetical protein [Acidobacteriota bacterium]